MAVETSLSDFHKMVAIVLRSSFDKQNPNIVHYRYYRNFRQKGSRYDLQAQHFDLYEKDLIYTSFQESVEHVLTRHAPMKQRYV